MFDDTVEEDQNGLGPGVKLKGATTGAIGPTAPVRETGRNDQAVETVEYAVLTVVEIPTAEPDRPVTLGFTALFCTNPNTDDGETYLNPSSVN